MFFLLAILFWLAVWAVVHSYFVYPQLVATVAQGKSQDENTFFEHELPQVYVVMSVYNEASVIREKMESLMAQDYPANKVKIIIGSDASSDDTEAIINAFMGKQFPVSLFRYEDRAGKANVLNRLYVEVLQPMLKDDDVLILTDANVMFIPETTQQLAKHFKDLEVGQVGANILNRGMQQDGISQQEEFYIQRENRIKYHEGLAWGTMMGAFGACYALRAKCFKLIPANYLMEDFYLSMHTLELGYKAIKEPKAVCYEDLPNEASEEFKRKQRISAGNWQNLRTYGHLLWPVWEPLGFSFFSHKVLRWLGPFFIATAYITAGVLGIVYGNVFYLTMFILQNVLMLLPLLDSALKKAGLHLVILRFVSYFYHMNLALLSGFFRYIRGVKTNVWQPTKRNT